MIHRLRKDRDFGIGWVGQLEDGRADDEHGQTGRAHDDEQTVERFAALFGRCLCMRVRDWQNLNAGHDGEDTGITAKCIANIFGRKRLQIKIREAGNQLKIVLMIIAHSKINTPSVAGPNARAATWGLD